MKYYKLEERAGFNLAPLQLEDLHSATNWQRVKWFYEVGVGKTVTSTVKAMMDGHHCHIITMPPVLLPQWGKWLRKVDIDSETLIYKGTPADRKAMKLVGPRWILMSHSIFRDDYTRIFKDLHKEHPSVIVDEAHGLKSSESQLFRKTESISMGSPVQLLTGTPTNKPLDAYAYIRLTTPGRYRSMGQFMNMHVEERDFFGNIIKYKDLELVHQNLMDQACQRTKSEMFPGIVKPQYLEWNYSLAPAHLKLYNRLMDEQILSLPTGAKIDATTAQRLYHAAQQIIVNYDHYSGNHEARAAAYDLIDLTIDQTQCMLRDHSKLIIWTWYTRTTESVLGYLEDFGAVGAYSGANSDKSVHAFMNDPACRILVAQPLSAGLGLEPQFVCHENLFLEYSTSPMHFIQAVGRTDRKGQVRMPTMRVAIAEDTIQSGLYSRLLHNGELVKEVEGLQLSIRDAIKGKL